MLPPPLLGFAEKQSLVLKHESKAGCEAGRLSVLIRARMQLEECTVGMLVPNHFEDGPTKDLFEVLGRVNRTSMPKPKSCIRPCDVSFGRDLIG